MINNDAVLFTELSGLGIITLNRPATLNALTTAMIQIITIQLTQWATATHIKAVVIRGAGERAFCAGGDIRMLYETGRVQPTIAENFFHHEYNLNQLIFNYPKPYIALLHGIVMGGGAGVSIHGSHRIAAENLAFAMPETGIGFFPDIGASYFLPRCHDKTGYYLGLTGNRINSADALFAGLIDHIVPYEQFDSLLAALADTAPGNDLNAQITAIIRQFSVASTQSALAEHNTLINEFFSADAIKKIFSALQTSTHPWAQQTLQTLITKCPISLFVTLESLQRGAQQTLADCLKMEYQLTYHFLRHHDFYEGVRAAVIDKDRNPQWEPNSIDAVNQNEIQHFFAPNSRFLII